MKETGSEEAERVLKGAHEELKAIFKKYNCIGFVCLADGLGNCSGGKFTENCEWTEGMARAAKTGDAEEVIKGDILRFAQAMLGCNDFIMRWIEEVKEFKGLLKNMGIKVKVKERK